MNIKTKVITIVIASILILPAILNPNRDGGEVLGVSEDSKGVVNELIPSGEANSEVAVVEESNTQNASVQTATPAAPNSTSQPVVNQEEQKSFWERVNIFKRDAQDEVAARSNARIKDISSGIRDINNTQIQTTDNDVPKQKIGKIKWEAGTTTNVVSGTYPVGSGVRINYNNSSTELVVNTSRILSPGTLLVVDPQTFIALGGDPEKESVISAEIIAQ